MAVSRLEIANSLISGGSAVAVAVAVSAFGQFNPMAVLLAMWAASPFVLLLIVPRQRFRERALVVAACTGVVAAGFNGWALYTAFIAHPDAQSGLVPLFLPVYVYPIVASGLFVASLVNRRGLVV